MEAFLKPLLSLPNPNNICLYNNTFIITVFSTDIHISEFYERFKNSPFIYNFRYDEYFRPKLLKFSKPDRKNVNFKFEVSPMAKNYILNRLEYKIVNDMYIIDPKIEKYLPSVINISAHPTYISIRHENFLTCEIIGQFNEQIILIKIGSNIIAIDQHAAHERIRLESVAGMISSQKQKDLACKGAVKFGQKIEFEKLAMFVGKLSNCKFPGICAHGRFSMCLLKK